MAWGLSHEKNFGNMLRLLRFGVYFDRILINEKTIFL